MAVGFVSAAQHNQIVHPIIRVTPSSFEIKRNKKVSLSWQGPAAFDRRDRSMLKGSSREDEERG